MSAIADVFCAWSAENPSCAASTGLPHPTHNLSYAFPRGSISQIHRQIHTPFIAKFTHRRAIIAAAQLIHFSTPLSTHD